MGTCVSTEVITYASSSEINGYMATGAPNFQILLTMTVVDIIPSAKKNVHEDIKFAKDLPLSFGDFSITIQLLFVVFVM